MTQVRARRRDRGDGGGAVGSRNPYIDLLRTRGAVAFSATAFVARMPMAMYALGTVLLIASLTGHYGIAGTVAAAGSVGYALCGPFVAQLADRLGQRRVLVPQTVIFTASSCAFIACAELGAPVWVLLTTGGLAGASMPSTGSMVRTRWSVLLGGNARRLHTAFALESVNDELIFVIGPALVTLLATQLVPASGIGTSIVLCVMGTLLFAAQRGTEPAPRPRPAAAQGPLAGQHPTPGQPLAAGRRRLRRPQMPAVGLITLSPTFLLLGSMFATIDLSTVAFATERGHRPLAGFILGTYAFGSAVGGLWYGTRNWRAPLGRRFVATMALTVAGVSTFWIMPGLLALDTVVLVAGMAIAPTLIAGYGILERQAPPHRSTEGMAWLGSTISVGAAIGSAVAGNVIDAAGARWGFIYAAGCGVLAVLISLAGLTRLSTGPAGQPAE
jgi:MFS family permease